MSTTKTLYKVTMFGQSLSLTRFSLEYAMGKTTFPKVGKIFVFSDPELLIEFVRAYYFSSERARMVIFAGYGTNPKRLMKTTNNFDYIDLFWSNKRRHKRIAYRSYISFAPRGTFVVDDFTPTKAYSFFGFLNEKAGANL